MKPARAVASLILLLVLQQHLTWLCWAQAHQQQHRHGIRASGSHSGTRRKPSADRRDQGRSLQSSLDHNDQTYVSDPGLSDRDYYVFHDVVLKNDSIIFCQSGEAAVPEDLPKVVHLSRTEQQIDLQVVVQRADDRTQADQSCNKCLAQSKPALLFSGPPWDHNFYEYLVNTLMPMFQTAAATGLLDTGRMQALSEMEWHGFEDREPFMEALFEPDAMSPFTLIAGRTGAFASPWTYFLDQWSRDQQSLHHMKGTCYGTLVVAEDAVLRFLTRRKTLMEDSGYRSFRSSWLAKFRQHIQHAENVHLRAEIEEWWPAPPQDPAVSYKRPRVVIATRPSNRRSILNEPDIVDYLVQHWDVNVTVTLFQDGLASAFVLMGDTDALIGIHGAGLTNALFMKAGGVLLQLLPYGFTYNETSGSLVRGNIFVDVALCLNGTYMQWENPNPQHAYFRQEDWDTALSQWQPSWGNKPADFMEHPDSSLQKPQSWSAPDFWMYQNTYADMNLLAPILDQAMEGIKAKRLQSSNR